MTKEYHKKKTMTSESEEAQVDFTRKDKITKCAISWNRQTMPSTMRKDTHIVATVDMAFLRLNVSQKWQYIYYMFEKMTRQGEIRYTRVSISNIVFTTSVRSYCSQGKIFRHKISSVLQLLILQSSNTCASFLKYQLGRVLHPTYD